MENATKALLIAAAVLIAIVLIALGVRLLSSTGDTTKQAEEVSEQMKGTTGKKVDELGSALGNLSNNRELDNKGKFIVKYMKSIDKVVETMEFEFNKGETWNDFIGNEILEIIEGYNLPR